MTKTTPLALIVLLAFASAARAQVARKAVPSDSRITDATTDFDDSNYPSGPVTAITFWGFDGAKTDLNADEDRLCDMDVAELASNAAYAAKRARAPKGSLTVHKDIISTTAERCDDREVPKGGGGYVPPPSCTEYKVAHCAARVQISAESLRLQYKAIAKSGTDKACRAVLVKEMESSAVIDSAILPIYGQGGKTGCALKVLELVPAK